jgi:ABC-type phosphate/phosphonate transport system permease subunit
MALIFIKAVGPGSFSGVLALGIHSVGSTALKSRPSISSAKSFPSIPTEWIPKANTPENEPGPTALINISA